MNRLQVGDVCHFCVEGGRSRKAEGESRKEARMGWNAPAELRGRITRIFLFQEAHNPFLGFQNHHLEMNITVLIKL